MRQATIARGTKETTISVSINLDGTGKYDIKTGVGFFDHMLEQLSRHSLVDMTIRADGDIHIDDHHTTEDVGIALGQAFKEALGDMSGITRYADTHLAMDEALTRVALDVSGRPFLVWQVDFPRDKVGTFDTELFEEFFRAFAMNAGFTLHIANLYGTNCHHIAETCFKAVARTVRTAIEPDPRQSGRVPTTKGQLGG
ncbi:imidazoleglycerol-phosphate dehydratase HisB [Pseudovibrio sp. POLY-S9]|uniref:imidazoleglycerol-phosphate dehydratase HisB n=1 Tax=Pseudovibrio sp. POLY-S9 TaxID=1576596 RepID=UPI00070EC3A2|nr:imidazoleglycerol-phosphate dehydratase HisB [Pseudovibrio sp. POLY-S9]